MIQTEHRDALQDHLTKAGVGTALYYPRPFHMQECFANLGYSEGDFPASECAAATTLALPIYPELTIEQMHEVVDAIGKFLNG